MLIQRCRNPRNADYGRYGGCGIRVCERWLASDGFANSLVDVGGQPFAGAGLRRLDPAGHYEPGNVPWSDTRSRHVITYNGRSMTLAGWDPSGLNLS